jgi:hypothetical protein
VRRLLFVLALIAVALVLASGGGARSASPGGVDGPMHGIA